MLMYLLAAAGVVGFAGSLVPILKGWAKTPLPLAAASCGVAGGLAAFAAGAWPGIFVDDGGYLALGLMAAALAAGTYGIVDVVQMKPEAASAAAGPSIALATAQGSGVASSAATKGGAADPAIRHDALIARAEPGSSGEGAPPAGGVKPLRIPGKDGCYLNVVTGTVEDGNALITVEAYGHSNSVFERRVQPKLGQTGVKWTTVKHKNENRHRTVAATVPAAKIQQVQDLLRSIK